MLSAQCFVKGIIMCTLMVVEVGIIGYRCDILGVELGYKCQKSLFFFYLFPFLEYQVLICLDDVILLL